MADLGASISQGAMAGAQIVTSGMNAGSNRRQIQLEEEKQAVTLAEKGFEYKDGKLVALAGSTADVAKSHREQELLAINQNTRGQSPTARDFVQQSEETKNIQANLDEAVHKIQELEDKNIKNAVSLGLKRHMDSGNAIYISKAIDENPDFQEGLENIGLKSVTTLDLENPQVYEDLKKTYKNLDAMINNPEIKQILKEKYATAKLMDGTVEAMDMEEFAVTFGSFDAMTKEEKALIDDRFDILDEVGHGDLSQGEVEFIKNARGIMQTRHGDGTVVDHNAGLATTRGALQGQNLPEQEAQQREDAYRNQQLAYAQLEADKNNKKNWTKAQIVSENNLKIRDYIQKTQGYNDINKLFFTDPKAFNELKARFDLDVEEYKQLYDIPKGKNLADMGKMSNHIEELYDLSDDQLAKVVGLLQKPYHELSQYVEKNRNSEETAAMNWLKNFAGINSTLRKIISGVAVNQKEDANYKRTTTTEMKHVSSALVARHIMAKNFFSFQDAYRTPMSDEAAVLLIGKAVALNKPFRAKVERDNIDLGFKNTGNTYHSSKLTPSNWDSQLDENTGNTWIQGELPPIENLAIDVTRGSR